jgi:hypothetical protein
MSKIVLYSESLGPPEQENLYQVAILFVLTAENPVLKRKNLTLFDFTLLICKVLSKQKNFIRYLVVTFSAYFSLQFICISVMCVCIWCHNRQAS